jgi:hypothetical protein
MGIILAWVGSFRKQERLTGSAVVFALTSYIITVAGMSIASAEEPYRPTPAEAASHFPTVRPQDRHVRELLANAMRNVAPENRMVDTVSGYPFEGWNQDPARGLFLRSFTQLTAIGLYMELLSNVAAGHCETPYLSRSQAMEGLIRLVKCLRQDQRDPTLSADNLLGNFLDLATGKRLGPLAMDVEKHKFIATFGREKGEAAWKALQAKGWIAPRNEDREAEIKRSSKYGWDHFDGVLAPFGDSATKQRIMDILDERVVMIVFIDNANLSASAAKTIGALLNPTIKDDPAAITLRRDLERFLDAQREGYERLYDPKAGQFYFGRDATKDRYFGWIDLEGKWVTGHVDYLVNEFRGPATFVVTRFGLPMDAIKNLGFKMKPYRMQDGRDVYVLAPWEGSAFQALGLELSMTELSRPSWRKLLENVVDVEIDYATRHKLPGFLSESYSGEGVQYTGSVGIPDITVSPLPRITDATSLYTLGAAYAVAPDKIERFLAANWPAVTRLFTEHGPWEGFKGSREEVIRFQTSAHTFSLILGLIGTASDHMKAYLTSKDLGSKLDEIFHPGDPVDFLSGEIRGFAWNDKDSPTRSSHEGGGFRVRSDRIGEAGIAFVSDRPHGVNLSAGLLSLHYRSSTPLEKAVITLKPMGDTAAVAHLIPTQIFSRFAATGGKEEHIQIPLPATPGLSRARELVITFGPEVKGKPIDLAITHLAVTPMSPPGG